MNTWVLFICSRLFDVLLSLFPPVSSLPILHAVGWLLKVELSNTDELKTLKDAKAYKAFCESEAH